MVLFDGRDVENHQAKLIRFIPSDSKLQNNGELGLFVPLPVASQYSGLSLAFLEGLIQGNYVPHVFDGVWKVSHVALLAAATGDAGRLWTKGAEDLRRRL
jgi:hypothetical protein